MLSKCYLETTGLTPEGTQCACADNGLIYNCNVVGGTTTLWSGTAFNCPTENSVILLRHSQFAKLNNQAFGICNNGDIVGYGIRAANNCYTSQLNVTVRESFNNKTVQCAFISSEGTSTIIGESLLSIISGKYF